MSSALSIPPAASFTASSLNLSAETRILPTDSPDEPTNYFKARKQFSSGVVEGLNNKAKVTMRRSYGFRTFRVQELALYHTLGKLPEPELTHEFF
jgi:hypothetical protein